MKIGIVGCGYWGPNLIRNFNALDDVDIVAVADLSDERLDFCRRNYPAIKTLTSDAGDILKNPDIDAVVIATPVSSHYPLGREALEHGKHLFLEKPFTASTEEAEKLIDLAEQKKLRIMVDHTFIYTGAVRAIKKFIDDGELGDIY